MYRSFQSDTSKPVLQALARQGLVASAGATPQPKRQIAPWRAVASGSIRGAFVGDLRRLKIPLFVGKSTVGRTLAVQKFWMGRASEKQIDVRRERTALR